MLGAIAQDDMKRILSFHIVSQIGYMVMGLGLFTVAGLAGAIFYIVHHIVVKTTLFLTGGLIEHAGGIEPAVPRWASMVAHAPRCWRCCSWSPALSLAGIPPLSGFVAKFALVEAGVEPSHYWLVVGVSLVVSLLTLFSMMKIWTGVFWSPAEGAPDGTPARRRSPRWAVADGRADGGAGGTDPLHRARRRPALRVQRTSGRGPAGSGGLRRGGAGAMSRLTLGAILVAVWLLLWGSITVANVLSGVAVAAFLFAVYPSDLPWRPSGRVRPVPFLVLCGRFVVDVVWSNVWLTIAVLGPQRSVHTELVRVELRVGDPRLIAMVTNLTALTPGAMVVRVDVEGARPVLLVHVLSVRDPDRFASAMLGLERRCVRALGSDEQVALVERAEVGR